MGCFCRITSVVSLLGLLTLLTVPGAALAEEQVVETPPPTTVIDMCANLAGMQSDTPKGLVAVEGTWRALHITNLATMQHAIDALPEAERPAVANSGWMCRVPDRGFTPPPLREDGTYGMDQDGYPNTPYTGIAMRGVGAPVRINMQSWGLAAQLAEGENTHHERFNVHSSLNLLPVDGDAVVVGTAQSDYIFEYATMFQGGQAAIKFGATKVTFNGGAGNDVLRGGFGKDALDGGTGRDRCEGYIGDRIRNCEQILVNSRSGNRSRLVTARSRGINPARWTTVTRKMVMVK